MSPLPLLVLVAALLLPSATPLPDSNSTEEKLSPYEQLQRYDFPVGVIPKGVLGYTLNKTTGDFTAWLSGTCEFQIQNSYNLRYQHEISGTISVDHMHNLKGIQVKILFFWLNIVEVTRSGNDLQFSVGIASADFGIQNFLWSPTCGCGFDCKTDAEDCRNGSGLELQRGVAAGENARKVLRQI